MPRLLDIANIERGGYKLHDIEFLQSHHMTSIDLYLRIHDIAILVEIIYEGQ